LQIKTKVSIIKTEKQNISYIGGILNQSIAKSIEILGSQNKLAEVCGVSHTAVNKWLKGGGISAVLAKRIEDATQGKVTMREIAEGCEEKWG
jgi:cro repressor